jgi:hypothetical protein
MDEKPSNKWTVKQLKEFLKEKNQRSSGNKADLITLAELYWDDTNTCLGVSSTFLTASEATLNKERAIFDDPNLIWSSVTVTRPQLPNNFDVTIISSFLTSTVFTFDQEEVISSGTEKPVKKGRQLYRANKIQVCEASKGPDVTLFRCTMEASLKMHTFR